MSAKYSRIPRPGKIGKLEIKNRRCNSPAIPNFSKRKGELNQREIDYYVEKATGDKVLYEPSGLIPSTRDVGVIETCDAEKQISCDTLVVGTGREPNNYLSKMLQGKVKEMCAIGDCVKPRWSYTAIGEGASVGITI